jgi:predicted lipoprotein with Yx(FWY)xxD motif
MKMTRYAAMAVITLLLGACAGPGQPQHKEMDTSIGKVLTTSTGMTLYTFANDKTPGKSACNGQCATNWPPLMASADAMPVGKWTPITRDDGSKQWAYDGKPLYAWNRDQKPGDTTGDGFLNGAWKAAHP